MRRSLIVAVPVLLLAVGCGGEKLQATSQHPAAVIAKPAGVTPANASSPRHAGTGTMPMCRTGGLSFRLGAPDGAAGSRYQHIVFTNTTASTCTLTGYPGVSFVAPGTGKQVGAAASRNAQHAVAVVTLAPGGSASATLQIVNYANYPSADCHATSASGLRVYPPGNTSAAYVPFGHARSACGSKVQQLTVMAVVAGA